MQYLNTAAGRILFYVHGAVPDAFLVTRPGSTAAIADRLDEVRAGLSG